MKVLLIFGSNGDLGKGVSKILCSKDYSKIYLFDRNPSNSHKNAFEIKIEDFSVEENVKRAFTQIESNIKAEYFCLSTIGGFLPGKNVPKTNYEDWLFLQNINLNISFLIAKHFSGLVENSSGGSLCFTSALTAINPLVGNAAYGVSKNGLGYLVKTLSKESSKFGFSVNAIAPYLIDTPENREWVKDSSQMVSPEDIGKLIYSIFGNYKILNGNILELPGRLKDK